MHHLPREAFIKEQGVCTAGHNAKFILKGVPTLNNSGVATVFLCHRFDRNFHSGYIVKLVLGDVDVHIHSHISDAGFDLRFFLFCLVDVLNQFGHRNGRKLDVEFLKQLTFVAHRAPEVKRTGRDLKDAGMTEGADDITDGKEVLDSPLKFGIGQVAVGHVGERYAETAENLTSREQAALGISQADAADSLRLVRISFNRKDLPSPALPRITMLELVLSSLLTSKSTHILLPYLSFPMYSPFSSVLPL